MTDIHSATRARIVEIAMRALKGCHLYGGHFGDTPAGMVADALMKELVIEIPTRTAQDYRDAVIDDGGYVTWPRKGEPVSNDPWKGCLGGNGPSDDGVCPGCGKTRAEIAEASETGHCPHLPAF